MRASSRGVDLRWSARTSSMRSRPIAARRISSFGASPRGIRTVFAIAVTRLLPHAERLEGCGAAPLQPDVVGTIGVAVDLHVVPTAMASDVPVPGELGEVQPKGTDGYGRTADLVQ